MKTLITRRISGRKKPLIFAIILILVIIFTACGAGGGAYSEEAYDEAGYSANSGNGFSDYKQMENAANEALAERKIIKEASLDIMADDATGLYASIVTYGEEIGGYEHSYSISHYEEYSVINAVFKVPPEKLSLFVNYIGDNGEVVNSNLQSDDITDNYYDAATRLDTKRRSLERYYDLLASADDVEEIVYIQSVIDGITEEIESLEGRLKVWNSQVNMATVNLYIRQNNDPLQIKQDINWNTLSSDDMGYLIKRGFFAVTNTLLSVVQWAVIILIGYSPVWIILAAGVLIWVISRKKRKAARKPGPENGADTEKRI
jgi:flagellar basal body-associated protein FliL